MKSKAAVASYSSFRAALGSLFALGLLVCAACSSEVEAAQPQASQAVEESPPSEVEPPKVPKRLFARKFVSRVRLGPSNDSPQLGYLRAGTVLTAKTAEPVGFDRCRRGWYEIAEPPGGFVCDGREVTAFTGDALPDRQPTPADRKARLPYRYAYNKRGPIRTPMYKRLPTEEEAQIWEDGIIPEDVDIAPEVLSSMGLDTDGGVPTRAKSLSMLQGERGGLVRRRLDPGFHVSLDREFDTGRRRYWRTMSNGYIPYSRMVLLEGSSFQGHADPQLPLAYIVQKDRRSYREVAPGRLVQGAPLPYREPLALGEPREIKGRTYYTLANGELARADDLVRIELASRPSKVGPDERWIDIDLSNQSLVAYEGDRPVYVTLVSTGRVRRVDNPLLNHATPAGLFRILSKHVSATMDGDHALFGAYSLEDVPYVQFFKGAYALHGAFWHDKFGRPASHGCINLAPEDARWLFDWTSPEVPLSWHAAYPRPGEKGTWLNIRGVTPPG